MYPSNVNDLFWNDLEINSLSDGNRFCSNITELEGVGDHFNRNEEYSNFGMLEDGVECDAIPFFNVVGDLSEIGGIGSIEVAVPLKRQYTHNNTEVFGKVKRMKKNDSIYEINDYIRFYHNYSDIQIEECEISNSVNMYMEKTLNENLEISESRYYRKPKILSKKTGIRDVDFPNNLSFKYCVLYDYLLNSKKRKCNSIMEGKKNYRIDKKVKELDKIVDEVIFSSLIFPVNPLDKSRLDMFEEDNGISLTIFGMENSKYIVLRRSEYINSKRSVFLLYIKFTSKSGRFYYVNNPKSILSDIYEDNRNLKNYEYCRFCLSVFRSKISLNQHVCVVVSRKT